MSDNVTPIVRPVETHNAHAIRMLEEWLEDARAGNVVTVAIVGKRIGNEWQTGMSASDNALEDAAMLLEIAIRRLGFVQR